MRLTCRLKVKLTGTVVVDVDDYMMLKVLVMNKRLSLA